MENVSEWFTVAGLIYAGFSLGATLSPTKKDDEVKNFIDRVFNLLSAIGLDLKLVIKALSPKK